MVITIHGIRTYGAWQKRLEELLNPEGDPSRVDVWNYNYNFFSSIAFIIPFLRWIETRRFRKKLASNLRDHKYERIDIVAHSFGTHIATWALHQLMQDDFPQIHTLILAGSVLKPEFRWEELYPHRVKRVVNECGTKDSILIINQLGVWFTGMAGRVGFAAFNSNNFRNRYFELGHSGYFEFKDPATQIDHMKEHWLPLLLSESPIRPYDCRQTPTPLQGVKDVFLRNSEPIKLLLYTLLILLLSTPYLIWIKNSYAAESRAKEAALLAESVAIQEKNRAVLAESVAIQEKDRALKEEEKAKIEKAKSDSLSIDLVKTNEKLDEKIKDLDRALKEKNIINGRLLSTVKKLNDQIEETKREQQRANKEAEVALDRKKLLVLRAVTGMDRKYRIRDEPCEDTLADSYREIASLHLKFKEYNDYISASKELAYHFANKGDTHCKYDTSDIDNGYNGAGELENALEKVDTFDLSKPSRESKEKIKINLHTEIAYIYLSYGWKPDDDRMGKDANPKYNKYQEAIKHYKAAMNLAPDRSLPNFASYRNMGMAYRALKQYSDAIKCYQLAIDSDRSDVYERGDFLRLIGSVHRERLNNNEALPFFSQALAQLEIAIKWFEDDLNEDECEDQEEDECRDYKDDKANRAKLCDAYFKVGEIYEIMGNVQQAQTHFEKCVKSGDCNNSELSKQKLKSLNVK